MEGGRSGGEGVGCGGESDVVVVRRRERGEEERGGGERVRVRGCLKTYDAVLWAF